MYTVCTTNKQQSCSYSNGCSILPWGLADVNSPIAQYPCSLNISCLCTRQILPMSSSDRSYLYVQECTFALRAVTKIILSKNVTLYGHEPHDVTSSYLCLIVKAFIEIMMGVSFLWTPPWCPFIDSRIFALAKSGDIA